VGYRRGHLLVTTAVRVRCRLCSVMRRLVVKGGVERECSSSNLRDQHLLLNIHRLSTAQKKNSPATILHNIQNLRTQLFRELFTYFPCPVAGRHFQKFKTLKNRFPANKNRGNWAVNWENRRTGNMTISLGPQTSLCRWCAVLTARATFSTTVQTEGLILTLHINVSV
jgi:hypothetical protein